MENISTFAVNNSRWVTMFGIEAFFAASKNIVSDAINVLQTMTNHGDAIIPART